ncbi:viral protein 2 [Piliocolobus badius polyomavirus 2]|uniref:Minor capsid protein VP2 n=2 Tax=Piliocolobus badius polyomavirus 2 TaxID=1236406 RepID=A0A1B2FQW4_9POLY|nr:viral protein 2 [Piliocolobus badius polyomavirus 2]ANY98949.1 viral protein 2 [Piliocolobus badius polyomavirus 2]
MGGVLSALVDMIVMATELSAASGLAIEALLSGEALAALEVEVFSLMTVEGLSGIEALAQLGWTAEQFSNMAFIASTFSNAIGYGLLFQTVSGISSLISVGIRLGREVSVVNRYQTEKALETIFGEIAKLIHINLSFHFDPKDWCKSISGNIPSPVLNLGVEQLSKFGLIIENGRWVVQNTPTDSPLFESGDIIEKYGPPGGANQRVTPDWMLPLILRLNGASKEKDSLCVSK